MQAGAPTYRRVRVGCQALPEAWVRRRGGASRAVRNYRAAGVELGCGDLHRGVAIAQEATVAARSFGPCAELRPPPGTRWVTGSAETCRSPRSAVTTVFVDLCSGFDRLEGLPRHRRTAMVRKGSPVRVRQRALQKPLETAAFLVPRSADAASTKACGPLLGRILFVSKRHGNARKGSSSRPTGRCRERPRASGPAESSARRRIRRSRR